jgi:hypothetical protein
LRDAIMARRPSEDDAREARGQDLAGGDDVRMLPAIIEMEQVLERMAEATGFLGGAHPTLGSPTAMARSPLDSQAPTKFFTPACSLSNSVDLAFALKGGLAASTCDLLVNGFAWPGVQTSIWTTVLVAQATQGAIVEKALLRLVGAAVGGLLGVLAIVSVMPNLENLVSFLVVVAIGSGCAAWLSTGSARIAYAGLQIGLAFALTLGDAPGPTTSMIAARDRVLGVLLGNVVAAVVYLGFGSGRARDAMAKSMAATLRSLSTLVRVGSGGAERPELAPTRGHRWTVYQNLLTTLRLRDEAGYEPGATLPETLAARDAVLRLVGDAQGLFLAILSLVRHRLDIDLTTFPRSCATTCACSARRWRKASKRLPRASRAARSLSPTIVRCSPAQSARSRSRHSRCSTPVCARNSRPALRSIGICSLSWSSSPSTAQHGPSRPAGCEPQTRVRESSSFRG